MRAAAHLTGLLILLGLLTVAPRSARAYAYNVCSDGAIHKVAGTGLIRTSVTGAFGYVLTSKDTTDYQRTITTYNANRFGRSLVNYPPTFLTQIWVSVVFQSWVPSLCNGNPNTLACILATSSCKGGVIKSRIYMPGSTGGTLANSTDQQFPPTSPPIFPAWIETLLHEVGHGVGLHHGWTRPAVMNWAGSPYVTAQYGGMPTGMNFTPDDIAGIRSIYGTAGSADLGLTWSARTPQPLLTAGIWSFPMSCGNGVCVTWGQWISPSDDVVVLKGQHATVPYPQVVAGVAQTLWQGTLRGFLSHTTLTYRVQVVGPTTILSSGPVHNLPGGALGAGTTSMQVPHAAPAGRYRMEYELVPSGADEWLGNNSLQTLGKIVVP